jgi:hypothetical protein
VVADGESRKREGLRQQRAAGKTDAGLQETPARQRAGFMSA